MYCRERFFCAAKIALIIEGGIGAVIRAHSGQQGAVAFVDLLHRGLLSASVGDLMLGTLSLSTEKVNG